jgi:D-alanyl-D-alanine carboxypeptidase
MCLLKLVNKENLLENTFVPEHLVQDPISKVWLCEVVYKAFLALNAQIIKAGMKPLVLVSGYRPYSYQEMLYDKKTNFFIRSGLDENDARKKAGTIVAVPGGSEHQLGLAIDLTSYDMKDLEDPLTEDFGKKPEGIWLSQNSAEYGFTLRYPKNKKIVTQITYEPWHFRYVGKSHATAMKELGMCLEEYIDYTSHK